MRRMGLFVWVLGLMLTTSYAAEAGIRLVENGSSKYQIVLQGNPSKSEQFAAEELQRFIEACTGCKLPVVQSAKPLDNMIVLGRGAVAKSLGVDPSDQQLGEQGFVLRTVKNHVVIAGTPMAGTMYGAHRFLQDYLGVRWYAPKVTKTPKVKSLTIPEINRLEKPAILHRRTSYLWIGKTAEFLARMAHNYGSGGANHKYGIQYGYLGACHTYFRFIHPKDYFDKHPEYFSEIGGTRRREETQLCLTNPEVLDIVTKKMLEYMKKYPQLRQFNFSQMDYYNYCQCDKCEAMNKKLGTPGGTQFWFCNELAKRTSKVYPDKQIGTLAYAYSEEAPRGMEMHPNVAVWLCHMYPSCDSHSIEKCSRNANYKRRALDWSKICKHLYIWHYTVDFVHYHAPFPNFRCLTRDLRFYRDIGVESIFLQGMGQSGGGGEFHLLRPYFMMQMAWNPDQDPDAVIKDFLQGYYGAAAEPMWKYMQMLHDKVDNDNIHMHLYTNPAQGFLTDDIMARAVKYFDQAQKAVEGDATLSDRVRRARMAITYASLFPRNGYKIEGDRLVFPGIASVETAEGFVAEMKKRGYRYYREWDNDLKLIPQHSKMMNSKPKIETISNEHLEVQVVPALAGRALRIIDRKTGKEFTAYNTKRNLLFPFAGGLENRTGEVWSYFGFFEPASVVEQTDRSITIRLTTFDGMELSRTITLDKDRPVLRVWAQLKNTTKKPKVDRLRSHLSLDFGPVRTVKVSYVDRAGKKTSVDMGAVLDGTREGLYYRGEKTPAGEWTFLSTDGRKVIHRFDPKTADQTWMGCYPEDDQELEVEHWGKVKTLKPSESVHLEEEFEIRVVK